MNDTTIQTDITEALRASGILIALRLTAWHAGKTDRVASEEVETSNNARTGSVRVVKNLLAGADSRLRAVHTLDQHIRLSYRAATRPWQRAGQEDQGGPRLLPNVSFVDFMKRMGGLARKRTDLVGVLVENWDADVTQARTNLGLLADSNAAYPPADAIASYFTMRLDSSPLPDTAGFGALPQGAAESLAGALRRRSEAHMQNAVRASFEDARGTAERIVRVLGADKPRIHDTLLDEVNETLPALRGFTTVARAAGMTDDADRLQELHDLLDQAVHGLDTKALRKSETSRTYVLASAKNVTDKLATWGF